MITIYKRNDVRNNTASYSLLHNHDNNNKNTYIYPDNIAINSLDIADGLKELLIKYGFTLEVLSSMPSTELAEFLGIDMYIAQIICNAAAKLSNDNYAPCNSSNTNLQTGNSIT
jgi:hypothetical protein